jgi:hypothetical protein
MQYLFKVIKCSINVRSSYRIAVSVSGPPRHTSQYLQKDRVLSTISGSKWPYKALVHLKKLFRGRILTSIAHV